MNASFRVYRILIIIFFCIIILLVFINFNLIQSINSKKSFTVNSSTVYKATENKYGYTDILKIIDEDINLHVKSIESTSDNGGSVKLNLTYTGSLGEFCSSLEILKTRPCLVSIGDIKISKNENNNDISFEAVFLKTK